MDADGTKDGYDLPLLRAVRGAVRVPVIASGGAGSSPTSRRRCRRVRTPCSPPASSTSATSRSARSRPRCARPATPSADGGRVSAGRCGRRRRAGLAPTISRPSVTRPYTARTISPTGPTRRHRGLAALERRGRARRRAVARARRRCRRGCVARDRAQGGRHRRPQRGGRRAGSRVARLPAGRWARRTSSWWTKNSTVLACASIAPNPIGLQNGGPCAHAVDQRRRTYGRRRWRPAPSPSSPRSAGITSPARVGASLAQHEVRGEVARGPRAAQRGGVGTHLEHQVGKGCALGAGDGAAEAS